jgi:hypothetical protein
MHLVNPKGSPATEASASGRAVEGPPVLVKLLLEEQYLHQTINQHGLFINHLHN